MWREECDSFRAKLSLNQRNSSKVQNLDNLITEQKKFLPSSCWRESITHSDLVFGKPTAEAGLNGGNW